MPGGGDGDAPAAPSRKRLFDVAVTLAASPVALPVLALCAAAIALLDGTPVLYRSPRRVHRSTSLRVAKFRVMRRDAERVANRDTVPVGATRFLNIPADSPLYTPVGRLIERLVLTELPQLWHVLGGRMSLVGNRPLPENVVRALREEHPDAEARFFTPAGLTGPVQLVGRDYLSDHVRLRLEAAYCRRVSEAYSVRLDLEILARTVLVGLAPSRRMTPERVLAMLAAPPPARRGARLRRALAGRLGLGGSGGGLHGPSSAEHPAQGGRP